MDLALRATLVAFAHRTRGGDLADAFALVDELVDEHGVPTSDDSLLAFMRQVEERSAVDWRSLSL